MKKLLILISLLNLLYAKYYPNALFAQVSGVASNDTLSVRVKPNWHSRKITELPPHAYVGVDKCTKIGHSTWCKVHAVNRNLGQYLEYNNKLPGWVNARYLKFSSRGYVAIKGKNRCNYAINCSSGRCRVVVNARLKNGKVTAIKSKIYPRSALKGIGELDIPNGAEGYSCGRLSFKIDRYLKRTIHSNSAKITAKKFLQALRAKNITKIKSFIHPVEGILITNKLTFSEPNSKHFSKNNFARYYRNNKKLYWGTDYAKGDAINMSLKKMTTLLASANSVEKIKTLPNLKGFKPIKGLKLKGYEFYWRGRGDVADYNWLGADVILAKIHGKWYVVGFLWNRWTI